MTDHDFFALHLQQEERTKKEIENEIEREIEERENILLHPERRKRKNMKRRRRKMKREEL